MLAVKGVYNGGDTVKLNNAPVTVNEPYEVVVAFLNPLKQNEISSQAASDRNSRKHQAFQHFLKYKGTLPSDFDYKKELAEYRNERHGCID